MTAAQIIILSILFIVNFYLSVIRPMMKSDYSSIGSFIITIFIWSILISSIIENNRNRKGCPQLEKVENVYKIV